LTKETKILESVGQGGVTILPPNKGQTDIIREDVSLAMIFAGIEALGLWEKNRDAGQPVTKSDLVVSIYAAMFQSR
jgi:hypothetical protein